MHISAKPAVNFSVIAAIAVTTSVVRHQEFVQPQRIA